MDVRSLLDLYDDGIALPPIAGGEDPSVAADIAPGDIPTADDGGAAEFSDTGASLGDGGTGGSPDTVMVDGVPVSLDDLRQWRDTYQQKAKWQRGFAVRDQQAAAAHRALERAFGRRVGELTAYDLNDIQMWGVVNERLRTDQNFAGRFQKALKDAYQAEGASPAQAAQQAKQDVAQAKGEGGPQAALPPELLQRLERLEQFGNRYAQSMHEQAVDRLAGTVHEIATREVESLVADIPQGKDFVYKEVLNALHPYSDQQLATWAQDGTLRAMVQQIAERPVQQFRSWLTGGDAAKAQAIRRAKTGTAPTVVGGGTPGTRVKPKYEARAGKGLASANERLRALLEHVDITE